MMFFLDIVNRVWFCFPVLSSSPSTLLRFSKGTFDLGSAFIFAQKAAFNLQVTAPWIDDACTGKYAKFSNYPQLESGFSLLTGTVSTGTKE